MAKYRTQPGSEVISGVGNDDELYYYKIVKENRAMLTIVPHLAATFAGKQYFYSEAFTLAETTDTRDYLFVTPNLATKQAHFQIHAEGSAITVFDIWEDSELAVTTDYSILTTYNSDRSSTDSATVTLYLAPAGIATTDSGTLLIEELSGTATQQSRSPSDVGYGNELFLDYDTKYRIHFETESTGNRCNMLIQWHEHTNEN